MNIYTCMCIKEPRGDDGLEGYAKGELYKCEYLAADKNGKPYWRVWPIKDDTYYETCSVSSFYKYFHRM